MSVVEYEDRLAEATYHLRHDVYLSLFSFTE